MRRVATALSLLALLSACGISDMDLARWGDDSKAKSNEPSHDELSMSWEGALTAERFEKTIVVDAGRHISIEINVYDGDGKIIDSCSGSSDISESNYDYIMDIADNVGLLDYAPPVGEDLGYCTSAHGYRNLDVDYEDSEGGTNSFVTSICSLENGMRELADAAEHVSAVNIPDCSEEEFLD